MKKSYITCTDQFCGAGGSSDGAQDAGAEVVLALNHWQKAIDTYSTNNPKTDVHCTDISACDPRWYQSTDILITSPECTNHSLAKGQKAVKKQLDMFKAGKLDASAERSRATMWDVCRFAEFHDYSCVIVENVVDARKWIMWDAWLMAMHRLGYLHECVYLNSMHCHPTPQSRDRMYIVFWKKGNTKPDLDYRPLGYCICCNKDVNSVQVWKNPDVRYGKYRQQYLYRCPKDGTIVEPYYYAAFNCIDWSNPGRRIRDRSKALAPNTIKRIQYGLDKFKDDPFIFHNAYSDKARGVVRSAFQPGYTQTTLQSQALIHHPFLIDDKQTTGIDYRVRSAAGTTNTMHTDPRVKIIMPFITKAENSGNKSNVKSAADVMQTQTTTDSAGVVVPAPFIIELKKTSKARGLKSPLSTATTVGHHGLITPGSMQAFLAAYNSTGHTFNRISDALGTQPTKERFSLVQYNDSISIDDCYYRMLQAHEIQKAMAFSDSYVICGSQKDKIKQLGNAVTPPAMKWLVSRVIKSLS